MKTLRPFLILLCSALTLQIAANARADGDDDRSKRAELIEKINRHLEAMKGDLYGVASESSADRISDAISQAQEMRSNVDALRGVKGEDSTANSIADRYPDYISGFNDAARALSTLKNAQLAQAQAELWKRCIEEDKNLRDAVKGYLDALDPDGIEKIPYLAEKAQGKIHEAYARQLDQANDIARARDDARRFSVGDGGWSEVSGRMRDGADNLWNVYEPRLKDTRQNCGDLDKGKDNPFIADSLTTLKGMNASSNQTLENIRRDWAAWKDLRRELAGKYVANATKIRLAICDGDEEQLNQRVDDAEESARSALAGPYNDLIKLLDELIDRSSKLESDKSVGTGARALRGTMRGGRTRLTNLVNGGGGVLMGAQNPKVRARIEVGKRKHKDYQESSSNCTKSEVKVGDGFIDCVKVDGGYCHIIEIKPNNDKAVAKGWTQVKRYQSDLLDQWRDKDKARIPEVFGACIDDESKELKLQTDVVTYDFCPVPDEDIDAMLADQVKQSSSTADEAP
jgi:hypothetical protein